MYMIFSLYWISYKKTSIASTTSGYTRASGQTDTTSGKTNTTNRQTSNTSRK